MPSKKNVLYLVAYTQGWKQNTMFGQKYPFNTQNLMQNHSRISQKNLFKHDNTISLEQSLKLRDDRIQNIQEEFKKTTPNLLDAPFK